jgi:MYXO-CTERM domain-containing protein
MPKNRLAAATAILTLSSIAVPTASADVAYFTQSRTRSHASDGTILRHSAMITHDQGQSPTGALSATRPNGSSTWTYAMPFGQRTLVEVTSPLTTSQSDVNAWCAENFSGSWQFSQGSGPTRTYDTSTLYATQADQSYLTLTADSISLFNSIRTQGLTGTFTFNLTESVTERNIGGWRWNYTALVSDPMYAAPPIEILSINGSSFDVTIATALRADSQLSLTNAIRYEDLSLERSRITTFRNVSVFGLPNPVPAPGALALLGLAGLGGGRRRRS